MKFSIEGTELSYEQLVRDIAAHLARYLREQADDMPLMSQRKAFRVYGRANVERWLSQGRLRPVSRTAGKILYSTAQLRKLSRDPEIK